MLINWSSEILFMSSVFFLSFLFRTNGFVWLCIGKNSLWFFFYELKKVRLSKNKTYRIHILIFFSQRLNSSNFLSIYVFEMLIHLKNINASIFIKLLPYFQHTFFLRVCAFFKFPHFFFVFVQIFLFIKFYLTPPQYFRGQGFYHRINKCLHI